MLRHLRILALVLSVCLCLSYTAAAQGLQSSPYSAPSILRGDSAGLVPSNQFRLPDSSSTPYSRSENALITPTSSKDIPNLQAGYVYNFGKTLRTGYFTLDYILPLRLGESSVLFGEVHSEWQDFWTKSNRKADDQAYLSIGGVYRTMLKKGTLVGINCFYDSTRFADRWYSSGGAGLEMAVMLSGNDALDMNLNWYANVLNNNLMTSDFERGLANYDVEIGYSHQLFNGGPDLRLLATGYKFDDGSSVYGWRTGAELKSADGVLSVKYETAYDRVNSAYQTVSGFINIGFEIENLLSGKNPFVLPERVFNSPRNLTRVTEKVKRHWRHTTHIVLLNRESTASNKTVAIVNNKSQPITLYMGFIGKPGWGPYNAKDFTNQGFEVYSGNADVLYRTVKPGEQVVVNFNQPNKQVSFALSADHVPWQGCPHTLAELTLFGYANQDISDISLVNGFNTGMELASSLPNIQGIRVENPTGNKNTKGVFGLGCDLCKSVGNPPCPGIADPNECNPNNDCHIWQPNGGNFVLSILP